MKFNIRTLLVVLAIALSNLSFAQKSKAYDANSYYKDYKTSGDVASLQKAKERIDMAAVHEQTVDDAFVHITRGLVYYALYNEDKKVVEAKYQSVENKADRDAKVYLETPYTNLITAYMALEKGKSLDRKDSFTKELRTLKNINILLINSGIMLSNDGQYANAFTAIEAANNLSGGKDSSTLYFCAVTAQNSKQYNKAIKYYSTIIENGQVDENTYASIVNVYLALKDDANAKKYLEMGRAAQPNNKTLVLQELDAVMQGDDKAAKVKSLSSAIANDPTNARYHLIRANMYEQMAAEIDVETTDAVLKQNKVDFSNKAVADYTKAISLKENYFEALFNFAILYNNKAVEIMNVANVTVDGGSHVALKAKARPDYNKAIALLEKALIAKPGDKNTVNALRQIYTTLQLKDKLAELNSRY